MRRQSPFGQWLECLVSVFRGSLPPLARVLLTPGSRQGHVLQGILSWPRLPGKRRQQAAPLNRRQRLDNIADGTHSIFGASPPLPPASFFSGPVFRFPLVGSMASSPRRPFGRPWPINSRWRSRSAFATASLPRLRSSGSLPVKPGGVVPPESGRGTAARRAFSRRVAATVRRFRRGQDRAIGALLGRNRVREGLFRVRGPSGVRRAHCRGHWRKCRNCPGLRSVCPAPVRPLHFQHFLQAGFDPHHPLHGWTRHYPQGSDPKSRFRHQIAGRSESVTPEVPANPPAREQRCRPVPSGRSTTCAAIRRCARAR